jgi:hypothetical protein
VSDGLALALERAARHGYTRITGGIDYGGIKDESHTTTAFLTMEVRPDLLITFWEYSKQGLAAQEFFEELVDQNRKWKPEVWLASAEQNRANQLLRTKMHLPVHDAPRYQGARDDGIAIVKRLLSVETRGDGTRRPALFVTENCTKLINAIETYRGERKDDDEIDGWRYNIYAASKGRVTAVKSEVSVRRPAGVMVRKLATSRMMSAIKAGRRARLERHIARLERET